MARRWIVLMDFDPDHLETFKTKVDEAAGIAEEGCRESAEDFPIGLWQRLFRTTFPQRAG